MGLTAQDLGSIARLSNLAANPDSTPRGDIYIAIATLYKSEAMRLSERERSLMREILQRLAGDVEMAIRIALAERLADDDSTPADLILLLADDRIEVARPIILRSRKLSDAALLSLIDHVSEEHQAACAARPRIGEPVCEALARCNAEPVLIALARNVTAKIAPYTLETLVEKSRHIAALQDPLAQRDDLPASLAAKMCDWVSDALKSQIRSRFPSDVPDLEAQIDHAAEAIRDPQPAKTDAAASAVKLVDKLAAASQLRAGFLMRVLHQGQTDLFEIGFAKLLQLDLPSLQHMLYEEGPRPVALACRAVGIDRSVFPTVFNLSRQARGTRVKLTTDDKADVDNIFNSFTKAEALSRLRSMAGQPY